MSAASGAGVCPIAAGFAQAAGDLADAIVLTTTCDQMRRVSETIDGAERIFLMNVPALWNNPASRRLYQQELQRLGRFLGNRGGRAPQQDALIQAMIEHDVRRAPQRISPATAPGAIRVALVGGPMRTCDEWISQFLASRGACVALDATETGQRALPLPFDPIRMRKDPLDELALAYFDAIPDAFRRPSSMLHEYLSGALSRHAIQAIVLIRGLWCDLWHAQLAWLRRLGCPVAEVDLGASAGDSARFGTRIEAMLEAIR